MWKHSYHVMSCHVISYLVLIFRIHDIVIMIIIRYMGVSENSVPLNPMVNDHYPYQMAISLGIYPIFRQTHMKPNTSRNNPSLYIDHLKLFASINLKPSDRLIACSDRQKNPSGTNPFVKSMSSNKTRCSVCFISAEHIQNILFVDPAYIN